MYSSSALDKELKLLWVVGSVASCSPTAALAVGKFCAHPKSSLGSTAHLAAGPSPSASFDISSNKGLRKSQASAIKKLEILARHLSARLGSNDY